MHLGYPTKVAIESMNSFYKRYFRVDTIENNFDNIKQFYTRLLLSMGLKLRDFKFGEKFIFLRDQNSKIVDKLMASPDSIEITIANMRRYIARMKFRSLVFGLIFLRGIQFFLK